MFVFCRVIVGTCLCQCVGLNILTSLKKEKHETYESNNKKKIDCIVFRSFFFKRYVFSRFFVVFFFKKNCVVIFRRECLGPQGGWKGGVGAKSWNV